MKIQWISVNTAVLKKFSGAMLTEIQWFFTESQRLSLIQVHSVHLTIRRNRSKLHWHSLELQEYLRCAPLGDFVTGQLNTRSLLHQLPALFNTRPVERRPPGQPCLHAPICHYKWLGPPPAPLLQRPLRESRDAAEKWLLQRGSGAVAATALSTEGLRIHVSLANCTDVIEWSS